MRFTLRQLEIFIATAHHQNISKAAESLAMSQSAASGALKELESQFDVQLFDRVGKRLQLNDFGKALQPKTEELLTRAHELEGELSQHVASSALRVGATLSIGNYLAVPMIAQFMERFPETRVTLEVANTATITQKLDGFELDVALIEGDVNNPDLNITPWRSDDLKVFCAPDHPLARNKLLKDSDLLSARWIIREPGSGTRQTFERALHDLLPSLDILFELEHTEAIKRAVESGLGLGCLSAITLEEAFATGRLIELQLENRDLSRKLYQVVHRKKYVTEAIENWWSVSDQF
ncbi:LysR substrate-binding domain-containing protein [Aurantivibrio plasticivorans]